VGITANDRVMRLQFLHGRLRRIGRDEGSTFLWDTNTVANIILTLIVL